MQTTYITAYTFWDSVHYYIIMHAFQLHHASRNFCVYTHVIITVWYIELVIITTCLPTTCTFILCTCHIFNTEIESIYRLLTRVTLVIRSLKLVLYLSPVYWIFSVKLIFWKEIFYCAFVSNSSDVTMDSRYLCRTKQQLSVATWWLWHYQLV